MVHTCNPSHSGDRGRKFSIWQPPRQKHETLSKRAKRAGRERYDSSSRALVRQQEVLSLNPCTIFKNKTKSLESEFRELSSKTPFSMGLKLYGPSYSHL
jgi:hypothetical protein